MSSSLRDELHKCAVEGTWWEPDNTPQIQADWIRELVVTGQIPETQTPVHAKGVRIRGVVLDGPLDFESARLVVPVFLDKIETGEPIVFRQATGSWISVTNSQLAGVSATQLRLDHSLDLSGTKSTTLIDLGGAKIGGQLSCIGGSFTNQDGYALNADGAEIGSSVFLSDGFTAQGQVELSGSSIGGQLGCSGGTFTNKDGDALTADTAEIRGDVFLGDGFNAQGGVRLPGASIGGQLICRGGTFSAPNKIGLRLTEANVAGTFFWEPKELTPTTGIDLTACSVDLIADDIGRWPEKGRLGLDRFTYAGFATGTNADVAKRIEWIQRMEGFHSQPYEQLASVYRAMGKTVEARDVGIAKEKARSRTLSWWRRRWHQVWGVFTAYGYRPAKALWIFAAILVGAGLFFSWAGSSGVMEPTDLSKTASATVCTDKYPCYEPFIYAADVMVPIVDLGQRDAWTPDVARGRTDVTSWPWAVGGTLVSLVTVLLVAAGWALTAAFIASASRTISRS